LYQQFNQCCAAFAFATPSPNSKIPFDTTHQSNIVPFWGSKKKEKTMTITVLCNVAVEPRVDGVALLMV
jgi:hypothetical protein